jgi:hypothetical protein
VVDRRGDLPGAFGWFSLARGSSAYCGTVLRQTNAEVVTMPGWTAEEIETLRTMLAEGHSASGISAVMPHHSRNAVLGLIHRKGLSATKPPPTRQQRAQRQERRLAKRAQLSVAPDGERVSYVPQVIYQPTKSRRFIDPNRDEFGLAHCMFPLNGFNGPNDADMPVCDNIAKADSSYCDHHHAICYPKLPPRQTKAGRKNFITTDPRRKPAFISEGA